MTLIWYSNSLLEPAIKIWWACYLRNATIIILFLYLMVEQLRYITNEHIRPPNLINYAQRKAQPNLLYLLGTLKNYFYTNHSPTGLSEPQQVNLPISTTQIQPRNQLGNHLPKNRSEKDCVISVEKLGISSENPSNIVLSSFSDSNKESVRKKWMQLLVETTYSKKF